MRSVNNIKTTLKKLNTNNFDKGPIRHEKGDIFWSFGDELSNFSAVDYTTGVNNKDTLQINIEGTTDENTIGFEWRIVDVETSSLNLCPIRGYDNDINLSDDKLVYIGNMFKVDVIGYNKAVLYKVIIDGKPTQHILPIKFNCSADISFSTNIELYIRPHTDVRLGARVAKAVYRLDELHMSLSDYITGGGYLQNGDEIIVKGDYAIPILISTNNVKREMEQLDVNVHISEQQLYKYKYVMKVGSDGDVANPEYGFDGVGNEDQRFGELGPNTEVLGYSIKTLEIKKNRFKFSIDTTNKEKPKQSDIKNIYLIDKDSLYTKKYSVQNISKFQDTGDTVKWYWDDDDVNYWTQRVGNNIDVIIEVEKPIEYTYTITGADTDERLDFSITGLNKNIDTTVGIKYLSDISEYNYLKNTIIVNNINLNIINLGESADIYRINEMKSNTTLSDASIAFITDKQVVKLEDTLENPNRMSSRSLLTQNNHEQGEGRINTTGELQSSVIELKLGEALLKGRRFVCLSTKGQRSRKQKKMKVNMRFPGEMNPASRSGRSLRDPITNFPLPLTSGDYTIGEGYSLTWKHSFRDKNDPEIILNIFYANSDLPTSSASEKVYSINLWTGVNLDDDDRNIISGWDSATKTFSFNITSDIYDRYNGGRLIYTYNNNLSENEHVINFSTKTAPISPTIDEGDNNYTANEGDGYNLTFTFSDFTATPTISEIPSWLSNSFTDNVLILSGTPYNLNVGSYDITINSVNGDQLTAITRTITVNNKQPVFLNTYFNVDIISGDVYANTFKATDGSTSFSDLTVINSPQGYVFTTDDNSLYTYTLNTNDTILGDNTITIRADDGNGGEADVNYILHVKPQPLSALGDINLTFNQNNKTFSWDIVDGEFCKNESNNYVRNTTEYRLKISNLVDSGRQTGTSFTIPRSTTTLNYCTNYTATLEVYRKCDGSNEDKTLVFDIVVDRDSVVLVSKNTVLPVFTIGIVEPLYFDSKDITYELQIDDENPIFFNNKDFNDATFDVEYNELGLTYKLQHKDDYTCKLTLKVDGCYIDADTDTFTIENCPSNIDYLLSELIYENKIEDIDIHNHSNDCSQFEQFKELNMSHKHE